MKPEACAASLREQDQERTLAAVWSELVAGQSKIVEAFATDDRIGLVIVDEPGRASPPIRPRRLLVLEEVLRSGQQKVAGIDAGVAASTVATAVKRTLGDIGLRCLPSRVPLLLVVAASAAREQRCLAHVRVAEQHAEQQRYRTVTLNGPAAWLSSRLSPCESRVAGLHVDGRAHSEIADVCGTSPRTVANHMAAVYRKLGVGSRLQLLILLAAEYCAGNIHPGQRE